MLYEFYLKNITKRCNDKGRSEKQIEIKDSVLEELLKEDHRQSTIFLSNQMAHKSLKHIKKG